MNENLDRIIDLEKILDTDQQMSALRDFVYDSKDLDFKNLKTGKVFLEYYKQWKIKNKVHCDMNSDVKAQLCKAM